MYDVLNLGNNPSYDRQVIISDGVDGALKCSNRKGMDDKVFRLVRMIIGIERGKGTERAWDIGNLYIKDIVLTVVTIITLMALMLFRGNFGKVCVKDKVLVGVIVIALIALLVVRHSMHEKGQR